MEELVLRSDVVTLKATTEKIQSDLGIDIHEAADIVLAFLRKHGPSMQLWKIPSRGLPYKDDEPTQQRRYSNEWLESNWWDKAYQQRQNELRELSGVRSHQDDNKIEDMALLRSDADLLLAGTKKRANERDDRFGADPELLKSNKMWEFATEMPKNRLMSIVKLLDVISNLSGGRAQTPELATAFAEIYDGDKTMIYRRGDGWLSAPIVDGEYYGYNKRTDISCGFTGLTTRQLLDINCDQVQYLIIKEDAALIAQQLWMKFFGESLDTEKIMGLMPNQADLAEDVTSNGFQSIVQEAKRIIAAGKSHSTTSMVDVVAALSKEIDPLDLPVELDAANMAFRAVSNGHGEQSATFKNRLIDYLEKNFTDLKPEAVQRIATVANPDKTTGRKKRDKE